MQFAGVVPPDAPDPMDELRARVARMSFPVMGLIAQPAIEDFGALALSEGRDARGVSDRSVSVSYTLWRNPDDHADPANLAELDARTRAALDDEPPWPRPAWLVQAVERMRYPQLWEAVRTSWRRDESELSALSHQLRAHANHILANRFRAELDLDPGPLTDRSWQVSESAVNAARTLIVDGRDLSASEIDTDPFIYAIGARLGPQIVVTAVLSREDLSHIDLALETRPRE